VRAPRRPPAAFLSHVRFDDDYDRDRLERFREHLVAEMRLQTGEELLLLQDRNELRWSQCWAERVRESLEQDTFLIPLLTPSYFRSPACREELEAFLDRERKLKRSDLVFPVYYVGAPELDDKMRRSGDKLAQGLASRRIMDWRDLRFEPMTTPQAGKALAQLALQLREALERSATPGRASAQGMGARRPLSLVGTTHLRDVAAGNGHGNGNGAQHAEEPEEIPMLQFAELVSGGNESSRRIVAKTEPPTIVVDPVGRGDFATITEAVAAAKPGDRILVRPGRYLEGVVIDKPIELLGDGRASDVVVEAEGRDAVLFKTTMGRVANMTLRQTGRGGEHYGVAIAQGRLDLEDCDISSEALACVAIHGGAEARLRRNAIHDGRSSGVVVYENAHGMLEDNEIYHNAMSGVMISKGAHPVLHRNRIRDGLGTGVLIDEQGSATLEDNEISGHALAEVAIAQGSNPVLRRNRIHSGHRVGVLVYSNGLGLLEANDIHDHKLAGVLIMTGGNPTLRRNRIHGAQQYGVHVCEHGLGILEENDITGDALAGVAISTGARPMIRRNRIHSSRQNGVVVMDHGLGTLEDNSIYDNLYAGVLITSGANPVLRRNRIKQNGYKAIVVESTGSGLVENNDLRGNQAGSFDVAQDSQSRMSLAHNAE
jgi:parallel beta-helix repeat protein